MEPKSAETPGRHRAPLDLQKTVTSGLPAVGSPEAEAAMAQAKLLQPNGRHAAPPEIGNEAKEPVQEAVWPDGQQHPNVRPGYEPGAGNYAFIDRGPTQAEQAADQANKPGPNGEDSKWKRWENNSPPESLTR